MNRERSRRARGARPRAEYEGNSLTRKKPWEAEGVSRRTWERRRRVASAPTAIPPLEGGNPNGASEPGLSDRRTKELAEWYLGRAFMQTRRSRLDAELRAILHKEVFPEHVEIEFERVIKVVFARQ
jgi:hypothetical protein